MGLFPIRIVLVILLIGAWGLDIYQDCLDLMQPLASPTACVASSDDPDDLRGPVAPARWDGIADSLIPLAVQAAWHPFREEAAFLPFSTDPLYAQMSLQC